MDGTMPAVCVPGELMRWGAVLVAYAPLLSEHMRRLHDSPLYAGAGLLGGYVGWRIWTGQGERHERRGVAFRARLAGGSWPALAVLYAALFSGSPWLAAFSVILLIRRTGRATWLLWLLLPIPFGLDARLTQSLQMAVSAASSRLLEYADVDHLRTGHVFELPGVEYVVDEGCSGVRSLFAAVAVTCVAANECAWSRGLTACMTACAIGFACLLNTLRVTGTIWLEHADLLPATQPGWHALLGAGSFAVLLWALWSARQVGRVFTDRFHTDDSPADWDGYFDEPPWCGQAARDGRRRKPTRRWIYSAAWGLAACLSVTRVLGAWPVRGDSLPPAGQVPGRLQLADRVEFPEWVLVRERGELLDGGAGEDAGEPTGSGWQAAVETVAGTARSKPEWVWRLQTRAGVQRGWWIVNGPFRDWHPVEACYRARGWQAAWRELWLSPGSGAFGKRSVQTQPFKAQPYRMQTGDRDGVRSGVTVQQWLLQHPDGTRAVVFHVMADADGGWVEPPRWEAWTSCWRNLTGRFARLGRAWTPVRRQQPLYQAVMFIELTPETRDSLAAARRLRRLFTACLQHAAGGDAL